MSEIPTEVTRVDGTRIAEHTIYSARKSTIVDPSRQPHSIPCPDCGRTHLNGENVTISVPAGAHGYRAAWSGCVDCWLRRTSPADNVESA